MSCLFSGVCWLFDTVVFVLLINWLENDLYAKQWIANDNSVVVVEQWTFLACSLNSVDLQKWKAWSIGVNKHKTWEGTR